MIDVAPGAAPVCPACGFGSGSGSAPSPAVSGPDIPPAAPPWTPPAQGGFSAPPPMGMPPGQQRTSGKAIAALVLGIVAVCLSVYLGLICGIIGLVLGILGMKEIDRDPQMLKGKGMAIAGIVLGSIGIVLQLIMILLFGALLMSFDFEELQRCADDPEAEGCEEYQSQADDRGALSAVHGLALRLGGGMPSWGLHPPPASS